MGTDGMRYEQPRVAKKQIYQLKTLARIRAESNTPKQAESKGGNMKSPKITRSTVETIKTVVIVALVTFAAGLYVGIHYQKNQADTQAQAVSQVQQAFLVKGQSK